MPEQPSQPDFLRRRNALWQQLRQAEPGTPAFEQRLTQLAELTRWSRERILAGLGLTELGFSGLGLSEVELSEQE